MIVVTQQRKDNQPIHDAVYQQYLLAISPPVWQDTSAAATNYADVYAAAGDCLRELAQGNPVMAIWIWSQGAGEDGQIYIPALTPGPDPIHGWTQ
jgi:hypothetical protein